MADKPVESDDVRAAFDKGDNRAVIPDHRPLLVMPLKDGAEDALVEKGLIGREFAFVGEQRHLGAGAGAAGRTVHVAGAEDDAVAGMLPLPVQAKFREQNLIIHRYLRMAHRMLPVGLLHHLDAELDQACGFMRHQVKAEVRGIQDREKTAAEADIKLHRTPQRWKKEVEAARVYERGDILQCRADRLAIYDLDLKRDEAHRSVEFNVGIGLKDLNHLQIHHRRGEADRAVAAHRDAAARVAEDDAGVRLLVYWRHHDCAKHIGVAARLRHYKAAKIIVVVAKVNPLLRHRGTAENRRAADDDTGWLSACV